MTMSRVKGLLSLCRKAGRIQVGFDAVKDACRDGRIHCVCTASDLSPKSGKEIRFHCGKAAVPVYGLAESMDDLSLVLGRRTGIIGIADKGFAGAIASLVTESGKRDNSQEE